MAIVAMYPGAQRLSMQSLRALLSNKRMYTPIGYFKNTALYVGKVVNIYAYSPSIKHVHCVNAHYAVLCPPPDCP